MTCCMSLKMNIFHLHLEFFLQNDGAVSDEQGERFHQDIQAMKERYEIAWNEGMMGYYCWMSYRDDANHSYKWKPYAKHF